MSTITIPGGKFPKGNVLTVNTGSTTTKFALFRDGEQVIEHKIEHSAEELSRFEDVMLQDGMRTSAILDVLDEKNVKLEDIDIVMCRGGMFAPCLTGVYGINADMREVLLSCRDGKHASSLSALIGEKIAARVNSLRKEKGIPSRYGDCTAYVADAPRADEKLPECKLSGVPEFSRISIFHVLNSRATLRRYLADTGCTQENSTVIICHMGGGITVSLHRGGRVIDANDGLGGDGPITPERAGTCPAMQLVEMCYSGRYTKEEVKRKLVGKGGAVAYFGTNDMREVERKAAEGVPEYVLFMKAFVL
ncbi:MAG: butyrate kinase, partial [Bacteroidales bacterium]|nr:butyrate kinase [Bacteroidales bacterium]